MPTIPLLSDAQWAVIEPLLPPVKGAMGRPMRDHRLVVEGAIYRLKKGIPWRCVNGHENLPTGGHEICPVVAMRTAR